MQTIDEAVEDDDLKSSSIDLRKKRQWKPVFSPCTMDDEVKQMNIEGEILDDKTMASYSKIASKVR